MSRVVVKRAPDMQLVAYALARCGDREGGADRPPAWLDVDSWREAYARFFDVLGDGRTLESFANSLKNARDTFDAHVDSRRIGWIDRDPARARGPDTMVGRMLRQWGPRSDAELRAAVLAVLARQPTPLAVETPATPGSGSSASAAGETGLLRARTDEGRILAADFSLAGNVPSPEVTFECADGRQRNRDYGAAIELVLARLQRLDAIVLNARVSSQVAERRAEAEGLDLALDPRPFAWPLPVTDVSPRTLRLALGRAGARVGRPEGTSGNTTKRITLRLQVAAASLAALAEALVSGAVPVTGKACGDPDGWAGPPGPTGPIATVDPAELEALRQRYRDAPPKVKHRLSAAIERGGVGALVKRANGYRCQVCEALGLASLGFRKRNGVPYVEAHHVLPVSSLAPGSLGPQNVITVCANHHRQMHYGTVEIAAQEEGFHLVLDGHSLILSRHTSPDLGVVGAASD